MLALPADKDEFYVSAYPFRRLPDEIGVRGRTLLGVLFYLSQAVEAPVEHLEKGLVGITRDEAGHEFNWVNIMEPIIRIRSDRDPPTGAFVSIRYRGYWFSIADNDRESKTTFNLLNLLFSMQTATAKGKSPMLTLPVGN